MKFLGFLGNFVREWPKKRKFPCIFPLNRELTLRAVRSRLRPPPGCLETRMAKSLAGFFACGIVNDNGGF